MNRAAMLSLLEQDEGLRLKPYRDHLGKLTLGIGRNLDDVGITPEEARHLAENDIGRCEAALDKNRPWWRQLSEARQRILVSMVFQLGWSGVAGFTKFWAAVQREDWPGAAVEMRDSLWAKQTPARCERLAKMMEAG